MKIGSKAFDTKHEVYMMGILNVTPDSFSDGGLYADLDAALFQAQRMIEEGAAILDVGGESTRPGYKKISAQEELSRVLPVIERIKNNWDIPVSLDTYKAEVAHEGLLARADLINDIWGLRYEEVNGAAEQESPMAKVIAESGAACVLMHNTTRSGYTDFWEEFTEDLSQTLRIARKAGIADEKIIIDPGVGFGKNTEENLEVIAKLGRLSEFSLPVLLAASRKSVIGNTLDLPKDQRLEGTLALTVAGVLQGASFIRVHDVKENLRAAKMALALRNHG